MIMNRYRTGIFLSLLLLVGFTSCQEKKTNTKLVLNEVLVDNVSNFRMTMVFTADGLKYSTSHTAVPIWQAVCSG